MMQAKQKKTHPKRILLRRSNALDWDGAWNLMRIVTSVKKMKEEILACCEQNVYNNVALTIKLNGI